MNAVIEEKTVAEKKVLSIAITKDPRWASVVQRDPSADGKFVYSVKTTGVYCRPSCGARRARPENVQFHVDWADAERAGFRPCKRCKPNRPSLDEQRASIVAAACRVIEESETLPGFRDLAARAGMSPHHFHRLFKAATGLTPREYGVANRSGKVRNRLQRSNSVTDAIYDAGYNSGGRFYETSDEVLGMTPSAYRSGGAGTRIHFAAGECSLGNILVAASERGVCAIFLGDDAGALIRELQDRFPRAELIGADRAFEQVVASVVAFVEAPAIGLDLPLDVRGTAFQQRVWNALMRIPAGSTMTYSELAKQIGSPKAVRAVGHACAMNPIAVAIPCHRVVRTDGSLSGYRWGLERKRALLDKESDQ